MSRLESWLAKAFVSPLLSFRQKLTNFIALFLIENLWTYAYFTFLLFLWPLMGQAPVDPMTEMFNRIFGPTPQFEFFMAVILAPFVEEILFRWIPLKFADAASPKLFIPILVLSQYIFGYAHGFNGVNLMLQGLGGLGMMWLYVRNGRNLWWTIGYHILWNLLATFEVI